VPNRLRKQKKWVADFPAQQRKATTDRTTVKKVSAVLKAAEEAPAPKAVEGKTVDEEGGESDETTKEAREMDSIAGRGVSLLAQDFGALFPYQHFPTDNLEKLLDFVTENIFKEETLTPPASINITFLSLWKN